MKKSSHIALETFVYRSLAVRLTIMAVVIGLLTAISVYFAESKSLQQQVAGEVRAETRLLTARTQEIIETENARPHIAFQQAINELRPISAQPKDSQFVYADFFQPGSSDHEEYIAKDYPLIDSVVLFAHSQIPIKQVSGEQTKIVFPGKRLHVWVLTPLVQTGTTKPPSLQTIFAPSEKSLQTIRRKVRRSVIQAMLIVSATSLVLYPVILQLVNRLSQFSRNLLAANLGTLTLLANAIAKRDNDTDTHNFRVTLLAVRLCEELHLDDDIIHSMIKGAFLHDIGKIGIPDTILLKPGKLDQEEFREMQEHVRYGLDIIRSSTWLDDATKVVGSHHEKYNGSGYPKGWAGGAIPLVARIFAVVDVFDALTSRRPYRQPLAYEEAMAVIQQGRGLQFDPVIVDAFATIAPELHRKYAGREDQGLRDELEELIAYYFSQGKISLD